MKECLLFNLPEPVTSKRLAAAFLVFNFGILIPFHCWKLHTSRQAMPFRPNNSNTLLIHYFVLNFKYNFDFFAKIVKENDVCRNSASKVFASCRCGFEKLFVLTFCTFCMQIKIFA